MLKSATYFLNADSGAEIVRQMRQTVLITQAMGGTLTHHPDLSQVQDVLDVYCGPGGWALELAFANPEIDVVGIDSNESMVEYAYTQARIQGLDNASFYTMDACRSLDFFDETFDMVSARFIAAFLSRSDWPTAVCELVRITRPGGIVHLTEFDEEGNSNSAAYETLKKLYARAFARNGQSFHPMFDGTHLNITPHLARFLQEAGCKRLQCQAHVIDFSAGTPAAISTYENLKIAYKLGQPFLLEMGVATQGELDDLYGQMLIDMLSDDFRALWYFLSVWGYKPD